MVGLAASPVKAGVPPYVALSLEWDIPTDVQIVRMDPDGVARPVRGYDPIHLATTTWSGQDYEAPLGVACTYGASTVGGGLSLRSNAVLLDSGQSYPNSLGWSTTRGAVWLRHLTIPSLSMPIDLSNEESLTLSQTRTVVQVVNRRSPIVLTDARRKYPTTTLDIRIWSLEELAKLRELLADNSVLQLAIPGRERWGGTGNLYVAVGDVSEERLWQEWAPFEGRVVHLPVEVVEPPVGGVVYGACSYWGEQRGLATYIDLNAAYTSYALLGACSGRSTSPPVIVLPPPDNGNSQVVPGDVIITNPDGSKTSLRDLIAQNEALVKKALADAQVAIAQAMKDVETTANGRNHIFRQNYKPLPNGEAAAPASLPTATPVTPAVPAKPAPVANDIWFDTGNGNRAYLYDGTTWVDARDAGIQAAVDTANLAAATAANGGAHLYVSNTTPTGPTKTGDRWLKQSDGTQYTWDGTQWVLIQFGTATLMDSAITAAKLAAASVTGSAIAAQAVTNGSLADGSITAIKVGAGEITTAKLAAGSVTSTIIADGSIVTGKIATGAVVANSIAANAVTASAISANAVTAGAIAAGSIISAKIAAGAVTATQMATGTITATSGIISSLDAGVISTGTLNSGRIAAGSITATQMVTGTITATSGIIGSLNATVITTGTLDCGVLNVINLNAASISGGTMTLKQNLQITGPTNAASMAMAVYNGYLYVNNDIVAGGNIYGTDTKSPSLHVAGISVGFSGQNLTTGPGIRNFGSYTGGGPLSNTGMITASGGLTMGTIPNVATGTAAYYNNTTGQLVKLSSGRSRKKLIQDLDTAATADPTKLYDLPVRQFQWRAGSVDDYATVAGVNFVGFVAEELNDLYPKAVITEADGTLSNWSERDMIPPMLYLIQRQRKALGLARDAITELQTTTTTLKNRLDSAGVA